MQTIFGISANKKLLAALAQFTDFAIGKIRMFSFSDHEFVISARGSNLPSKAVIVQSMSYPVERHFFELSFLANSLWTNGVNDIVAVIPYFGFARQEVKGKEVSTPAVDMLIEMLKSAHISSIITYDIHASEQGVKDSFYNVDFSDVFLMPIKKFLTENHFHPQNTIFVIPDGGATKRLSTFLKAFPEYPISQLSKRRPQANKVRLVDFTGEVINRHAIMLDDIIDTGGTTELVAEELRKRGALDMYVVATHGVFSGDYQKHLGNPFIKKIITTDSIDKTVPGILAQKIIRISLAENLANILKRIDNKGINNFEKR